MPRGCWRGFVLAGPNSNSDDLLKQCRMMYRRSLDFFVNSKRKGANTFIGELGDRTAKQKEDLCGCHNSLKCPALGLRRFEFSIYSVEVLRCRADSVLLMQKARSLRQEMILSGVPDADLPNLDAKNGPNWFARWRKRFNIVKHAKVLNLKVSWQKIKRRVYALYRNY